MSMKVIENPQQMFGESTIYDRESKSTNPMRENLRKVWHTKSNLQTVIAHQRESLKVDRSRGEEEQEHEHAQSRAEENRAEAEHMVMVTTICKSN